MYLSLLTLFVIGVLTKLTDLVVDEDIKAKKPIAYVTGIIYGILIAYALLGCQILAPVGFAVLMAVIATGKIDKKPHILGVVSMVLVMLVYGFPKTDLFLLALFLAAGVADEVANDFTDNGRIKGVCAKVLKRRIILDIATFAFSISTGFWIIFFAMFAYDAGYQITERAGKRFK